MGAGEAFCDNALRVEEDPQRTVRARALFRAAFEAQQGGDLERAIELYTASIKDLPTAEAYTYRGWAFSFQKKYDEAIADCLKAIECDPSLGNAYNDIGAYLIEQGKLDAAVPWLEKALRAPRYEARAYPYFNLGRVYASQGMLRRSADCYRSALQERADFEPARKALEDLIQTIH
jgi:Tfp pilus assembly protein PilF